MTIGKRIGLGFLAPLAILLAVAAVACWTVYRLIDTAGLVTHTHQMIEKIGGLLSTVEDAESEQRGYLLTQSEGFLAPFQADESLWEQQVSDIRDLTPNSRQQHRLDELKPKIQEKFKILREALDLRQSGKGLEETASKVKAAGGVQTMVDIRTILSALDQEERDLLAQREADAKAAAVTAYSLIGAATLLACIVVAVVGWLITRSITRPVARLLEGTVLVGQGKLDHRVSVQSNDELGELARAFNGMTEKRQQAVEGIRAAVGQLASASTEILATTTQQAAGAQEQAAAVSETVATVDEVTQTSDQASQRARGLGEAVGRALQVGQAGRKVVDDSIAALARVQEQVETTAQNILALAEQAQAIGDITTLVADVAEQTNLLALERRHRGQPSGRARPGLRRGGRRGQGPGRPVEEGDGSGASDIGGDPEGDERGGAVHGGSDEGSGVGGSGGGPGGSDDQGVGGDADGGVSGGESDHGVGGSAGDGDGTDPPGDAQHRRGGSAEPGGAASGRAGRPEPQCAGYAPRCAQQ